MNKLQLRQKIESQLDQLSPERLAQVSEFIDIAILHELQRRPSLNATYSKDYNFKNITTDLGLLYSCFVTLGKNHDFTSLQAFQLVATMA